ncbi:MAG: hypothetical protein ABIK28_04585 [Planctomycetota bacterium]
MAPGAAVGSSCDMKEAGPGCSESEASDRSQKSGMEDEGPEAEQMFCPHCNADRTVRSTYEGKYECTECKREIP